MHDLAVQTPNSLLQKQHQWPLIAKDIALMTQPTSAESVYTAADIAKNYDLTPNEFTLLMRLPVFSQLVRDEMDRLKQMGPFAGHKLRAEAIISDLQEQVYLRAKQGLMEDKLVISYLGMLMRSIGMDMPSQDKTESVETGNITNINIAFNIPKLLNKKLAHIAAIPHNTVVDVV